jgi:hypothetical protein
MQVRLHPASFEYRDKSFPLLVDTFQSSSTAATGRAPREGLGRGVGTALTNVLRFWFPLWRGCVVKCTRGTPVVSLSKL